MISAFSVAIWSEPGDAYPFERCFLRLLNSQRARDGSLCREPVIPGCARRYSLRFRASICGANRLLVKHVSGLLPENLSRYVSPVPVAVRTVGGYRLGRQDFHLGRDDFSAPFALHHVAHKYLCLSSCGFGRQIWSLLGPDPMGTPESLRPRSPKSQPRSYNQLHALAFLTCAGSHPFGI
jgi:hypothetical protein